MKMVVVIPTHGRKSIVAQLLSHLEGQVRLPDEVVLSVPDRDHVGELSTSLPLRIVSGRQGLCAQRNQALDAVVAGSDVVTFLDDDFLPADDYLAGLERLFQEHGDWAVVTGNVVKDGARGSPLTFEEGLAALSACRAPADETLSIIDRQGVYGCNMSMRSAWIGDLRFDERLALYGWQEDVDFTSQLQRFGRVVEVNTLRGVHLGFSGGRVSGVRLGYSQVVNPVYLIRKRTIGFSYGIKLVLRNFAANVVRSFRPEPHIDRRGRLHGNLLGLWYLATGRGDPERVVHL
jgi:GT2 family glycosyltransferase